MNYERHHDLLIEKHGTWEKPKGVYTERHRKIPGCLGGKYVKGNAFYMSARAHYVAHLLLARSLNITPLWNAIVSMGGIRNKTSSVLYESAKVKALPLLVENGIRCRDNKSGFHSWSKDKWVDHGNKSKMLKIGIFDPNTDRAAAGKLGGAKIARLGIGIHTKESRSAAGKKGILSVHKALAENKESKDKMLAGASKGSKKAALLWKIPEYKQARLDKDVETYKRICREFKA